MYDSMGWFNIEWAFCTIVLQINIYIIFYSNKIYLQNKNYTRTIFVKWIKECLKEKGSITLEHLKRLWRKARRSHVPFFLAGLLINFIILEQAYTLLQNDKGKYFSLRGKEHITWLSVQRCLEVLTLLWCDNVFDCILL